MTIASLLFEQSFDFPFFDGIRQIEVMVAAVPRSGSTMFCLDLWETGVLGSPLEYLNLHMMRNVPRWQQQLANPLDYWQSVKNVRTSINGVFSYKMFSGVYKQVAKASPELLTKITPTHVIYFTREDLDAQAISYSKAMQSGAWFGDVLSEKPPKYSYEHIVQCKELISRQMQDWEYIFDLTKTNVYRVSYEQILEDKDNVVARISEYITGSSIQRKIVIPHTTIQRDNSSLNWKTALSKETLPAKNRFPNVIGPFEPAS